FVQPAPLALEPDPDKGERRKRPEGKGSILLATTSRDQGGDNEPALQAQRRAVHLHPVGRYSFDSFCLLARPVRVANPRLFLRTNKDGRGPGIDRQSNACNYCRCVCDRRHLQKIGRESSRFLKRGMKRPVAEGGSLISLDQYGNIRTDVR